MVQYFASCALLFLFLQPFAYAATAATVKVCSLLHKQFPHQLVWDPLTIYGVQTILNATLYLETSSDYWNFHSEDNRAACIFYPSNAEDVSFAVKTLNDYKSVDFALKSGGHNSNLGFSSSDKGVLVSFRPNLASTQISADNLTADIGPGSKWGEAISTVGKYGKAVVGGRLGHVGVGGYLLGGGLSFLTSQYGFGADTIVNYEVVLANGTISNANATTNIDLFWALKGGGNAFAIVTKFTLKTFSIGQVWGGTRIYSMDKHSALLAAVSNFTESFHDNKAAIIPTFNFGGTADIVNVCVVFLFYDGDSPPTGVFDEFDAIDALVDDVKTQSYPDLLTADNAESLSGLRYQIRENTFPQLPSPNMTDFLNEHWEMVDQYTFNQSLKTDLDFQVFSFALQPIPVAILEASKAMGGNAMGLSPAQGDRIFVEYDISWINPDCDNVCPSYVHTVAEDIKSYQRETYNGIPPTKYREGDLDFIPYNPIFMNDGMYDQPVLQSYGDSNYQRLKAIQKAMDPDGFFATRQGGFKFDT